MTLDNAKRILATGLLLTLVLLGLGAVPAAGAAAAGAASAGQEAGSQPPTGPEQASEAQPSQAPADFGPLVVRTGIFVENISDIDLRSGSFLIDFYLWFFWQKHPDPEIAEIDPTETFEFKNSLPLELSQIASSRDENGDPVPEAITPDGPFYQVFHVNGRFLSQFDTDHYPLDEADLQIAIEDSLSASDTVVYEYDPQSGISGKLSVAGRDISAPVGRVIDRRYSTSFGYPGSEAGDTGFSRLEISMHAERPGMALILQSIFPLVVIIFAAMASLLIESPLDEESGDTHWWWLATRLSLAVPAVIAAVALQFTAATGVPRDGQVLLIDRIYLLSYAIILLVIGITVITHRMIRKGSTRRIRTIDRTCLALLLPLYLGGIVLILIAR